MKKWGIAAALLFLLVAVIIGCGADNKKIYEGFAVELEGPATPARLREAVAYLDENIGRPDQEAASLMLVAYEDHMLRYLNSDADWTAIGLLQPYWNSETQAIEADRIDSDETRTLYEDLAGSGFRFISREGMIEPIIDYAALNERYERHITEALSALYTIKAMESDEPMAEDAALRIPWDALALRAYAVEQYIEAFSKDPLTIDDARFLYENYANTMLLGLNNTPAFSYETTMFSGEAMTAYVAFITDHPNSVTAWMLREYLNYVNEIGSKMDYRNQEESKAFLDTCAWLVSEAGKKAMK